MGYLSVFLNQKTSLKKECKNKVCLASEFDNIWYNCKKVAIINNEAIQFYNSFLTLQEARKISDHIPIATQISIK